MVGLGSAKVWSGSTWTDLGADVSSIIGSIPNGTSTSTDGGITVQVDTTHGSVTTVSVEASQLNLESITASSATFTELVVADTATFDVTNVVASSLTINGDTVEDIADARIAAIAESTVTGASNGITVGVTTSGGSVTAVSVNAGTFANAMHFVGVTSSADMTQGYTGFPSDKYTSQADVKDGDIVLSGTKEYVWDGSKWEQIGDQNVLVYSSTATVVSNATTIPDAIDALATAFDGLGDAAQKSVSNSLASDGTNLPTESAVAAYVSSAISSAELVWLDDSGEPIDDEEPSVEEPAP